MCGEDGAQREVYKLKEEPENRGSKREKEKKKTKKRRETRERRKQEGRVVLVTKEKRSLDRLKT